MGQLEDEGSGRDVAPGWVDDVVEIRDGMPNDGCGLGSVLNAVYEFDRRIGLGMAYGFVPGSMGALSAHKWIVLCGRLATGSPSP